jgi:hypothetical protein
VRQSEKEELKSKFRVYWSRKVSLWKKILQQSAKDQPTIKKWSEEDERKQDRLCVECRRLGLHGRLPDEPHLQSRLWEMVKAAAQNGQIIFGIISNVHILDDGLVDN